MYSHNTERFYWDRCPNVHGHLTVLGNACDTLKVEADSTLKCKISVQVVLALDPPHGGCCMSDSRGILYCSAVTQRRVDFQVGYCYHLFP